MSANSHFKKLLRKFNEHSVKFLIVGAYAVMKYTEPRYTKDLDIWVEPSPKNAQGVFNALAEFGAPMDGVTPQDFTNQEVIFQIGIEPHRIDVLMAVKGLQFADAWAQRVTSKFDDERMMLVCKEDLLIAKEAMGRPQDLLDAEALRRVAESPTDKGL
jgi:predicted nucleotidyltransferase